MSKARIRKTAAFLAGLLAVLTLFAGNLSVWARRTIFNEKAFLEVVKPLPKDEAISRELAIRITNGIYKNGKIDKVIDSQIGEKRPLLAVALKRQARSVIEDAIATTISSDRFSSLWVRANTAAHRSGIRFIRVGDTSFILDTKGILEEADRALRAQGINVLSSARSSSIVLVQPEQLGAMRKVIAQGERLAIVLPFIGLLLAGLAVYLASRRRRATIMIALSTGLSLLLVYLGARALLDHFIGSPVASTDAAIRAVIGYVIERLRNQSLWLSLIAFAVALWVGRRSVAHGFTTLRRKMSTEAS